MPTDIIILVVALDVVIPVSIWLIAVMLSRQEALHLRVSQDFHDLCNQIPCGCYLLDSSGHIAEINEIGATWLGYRQAELSGRVFVDLLMADSRTLVQQEFQSTNEPKPVGRWQLKMLCKDGGILPVLLSVMHLKGTSGSAGISRVTVLNMT